MFVTCNIIIVVTGDARSARKGREFHGCQQAPAVQEDGQVMLSMLGRAAVPVQDAITPTSMQVMH